MTTSRTITLEILRDGPPHNQLLSPLTVYLAKCQNRPAESIRLNIEHGDFLRWQAGLTYASGRRPSGTMDSRNSKAEDLAVSGVERRNAIADASKAVTNFFGLLRSLLSELACEPCEWRHIHLVVDASEIGALPFELAFAAPGLMVQGERLFVQQNARITLTRQAHRVATSVVTWPKRPRILLVIADGDLPGDAHALALWEAIDPWLGMNDGDASVEIPNQTDEQEDERRKNVLVENRIREAEQILTILENPTLDRVSEEVSRTCFTHVHILAHGTPMPDASPGQTLYGLWFRGANGERDVVDGDRLEAALRHPRDCQHPTVVTLATCESANLSGAILGPGGSVAHATHTKGVPLVVASQFPLSKHASVVATDMLYKAFFRGDDPRVAIHAIRRELLVSHPNTHDWASLVLYASLPPDLEEQLRQVKMSSDKLAAETAVERLRVTLRGHRRVQLFLSGVKDPASGVKDPASGAKDPASGVKDPASGAKDPASGAKDPASGLPKDLADRIKLDVDRLDSAVAAVRGWTSDRNDNATRMWGYRLLARIALRLWEAYSLPAPSEQTPSTTTWKPFDKTSSISSYLKRAEKHDFVSGQRAISMYSPDQLMRLAKDSYEATYFLDTARAEIWVQVVALYWALGVPDDEKDDFERDLNATRHMAWLLAERVAKAAVASRDERAMAAAVGFEAEVLAYLALPGTMWGSITGSKVTGSKETDANAAMDATFKEFVRAAAPIAESYRAHCAWKQLRRYEAWAADRNKRGEAEKIRGYRHQLEMLGVRQYWGPRTRNDEQPMQSG